MKKNRNYGIDIYKILSVLMVIILHILGQGGPNSLSVNHTNYLVSWAMTAFCYGAVNCFALASGYLLVNSSFKLFRLIEIWFQVIFYSLGITIIFSFLNPNIVSIKTWLISMFPILFREYWYFTAYIGMLLLTPLINSFFKYISKRTIIYLFLVIGFFSIYSTINADVFQLHDGYSVLWLYLMFIVGAGIKKLDIKINKKEIKYLTIVFIILSMLTFISLPIMAKLTKILLGHYAKLEIGYTYVSPLIILSSCILLIICTNLVIENSFLKKICIYFSPVTFDSYLLHVHPIIFGFYLKGAFSFLSNMNPIIFIMLTLGIALISMIIFGIIGHLRIKLFNILNIQTISKKIANTIYKCVNKLMNIIYRYI